MLGYLLPSVHELDKHYLHDRKSVYEEYIFIYEDCGPLMNSIINDFANLLNIRHELIPSTEKKATIKACNEEIQIPRWDTELEKSGHFIIRKNVFYADRKVPITHKRSHIKYDLQRIRKQYFGFLLKRQLQSVRRFILEKLLGPANRRDVNHHYLLLKRSNEPSYYNEKDGTAEIKGYGASRRALKNIELAAERLIGKGIPIKIYEPGADSISDQIKTFYAAKGVIGIRGAEAANLIWLKPKSKVVIIDPNKRHPMHLLNYGSMLELRLVFLRSDKTYPDILDFDLEKYLA